MNVTHIFFMNNLWIISYPSKISNESNTCTLLDPQSNEVQFFHLIFFASSMLQELWWLVKVEKKSIFLSHAIFVSRSSISNSFSNHGTFVIEQWVKTKLWCLRTSPKNNVWQPNTLFHVTLWWKESIVMVCLSTLVILTILSLLVELGKIFLSIWPLGKKSCMESAKG